MKQITEWDKPESTLMTICGRVKYMNWLEEMRARIMNRTGDHLCIKQEKGMVALFREGR
jgi:hypothetical protein